MIPAPPGFSAIIAGLAYAFRLSTRAVHPNNKSAHPQDSVAIWHALWFRLMVTTFNGVMIFGFKNGSLLLTFFLISLIDTLSYPVVSHSVLARSNLIDRYHRFITCFTWVGNLRVLLMMAITLTAGLINQDNLQIMILPFAIWMIWAAWSVSTQSLERGGWVGAGMVFLALILEMLLGALIITFIHPNLPVPQ